MSSVRQPTVVVGVDGTTASLRALRWAADEARQRGARIHVVRTWDPQFSAPYAVSADDWACVQQCTEAGASLSAQLGEVFGPQQTDGVSSELTQGVAERVLVDRSAGADLLVLGSAAAPPLAGRAIGSVVRACLRRAYCPVVVVSADEQSAGHTRARLAELAADGDREALRALDAVLAAEPG